MSEEWCVWCCGHDARRYSTQDRPATASTKRRKSGQTQCEGEGQQLTLTRKGEREPRALQRWWGHCVQAFVASWQRRRSSVRWLTEARARGTRSTGYRHTRHCVGFRNSHGRRNFQEKQLTATRAECDSTKGSELPRLVGFGSGQSYCPAGTARCGFRTDRPAGKHREPRYAGFGAARLPCRPGDTAVHQALRVDAEQS